MTSQSRKRRQEIIDLAARRGEIDTLVWAIEMLVPMRHRKGVWDDGYRVACYPGRWVPTIPYLQDVDGSQAEFLAWLFTIYNSSEHKFAPVLTSPARMRELDLIWYTYGEEEPQCETICEWCGAVGDHECPVNGPEFLLGDADCTHVFRGRVLCGKHVRPLWAHMLTARTRRLVQCEVCKEKMKDEKTTF